MYLKFTSTKPVAPRNLGQSRSSSGISHLIGLLSVVAYVLAIAPKVGAAFVDFCIEEFKF